MLTYAIFFFAFFSCTLTPLGCTLSFSLKKNYLLGFAFYSPFTKRTRCVSLSYSSHFFVESLLCTLRVHLFPFCFTILFTSLLNFVVRSYMYRKFIITTTSHTCPWQCSDKSATVTLTAWRMAANKIQILQNKL